MTSATRLPGRDGLRAGEAELFFPCDRRLAGGAEAYYRAIDVAAPAEALYPWLCQLRLAPYSYDWLDNLGRRSPRRLHPGTRRLEVGQSFMSVFTLAEFEPQVQITLRTARAERLLGEVACTYLIVPGSAGGSRLIVKVLARHPGGRLEAALRRRLLPWADLAMMRKQLRTLAALAERQAGTDRGPGPTDAPTPLRRP